MDKRQKQSWRECDSSGCMYMPRCTHYWGNRCKNLGGKKIPRIRSKHYHEITLIHSVNTLRGSYFLNASGMSEEVRYAAGR